MVIYIAYQNTCHIGIDIVWPSSKTETGVSMVFSANNKQVFNVKHIYK